MEIHLWPHSNYPTVSQRIICYRNPIHRRLGRIKQRQRFIAFLQVLRMEEKLHLMTVTIRTFTYGFFCSVYVALFNFGTFQHYIHRPGNSICACPVHFLTHLYSFLSCSNKDSYIYLLSDIFFGFIYIYWML